MSEAAQIDAAAAAMRQINQAWLAGNVDGLSPLLHPQIVMAFPDFSGRVQGRDSFLAGFSDFCQQAKIHEYHEHDHQVDVVGKTAVVSFKYVMVYERDAQRFRAAGRDLWVFEKQDSAWIAVWRTMLDMEERPA